MEHGCEHTEGSPIGKCGICDRTVCTDCYRDVFGAMICDLHEELEDDSEWELVGFYSDDSTLAQKRYLLEENSITSLAVESDEDAVELYVPNDEKDDAFASLSAAADGEQSCAECEIQFSGDMDVCPVCGVKPAGGSGADYEHD